ncbi:MAG: hypothetical protein PHF00_03945 [Elusimicrobia bacterium]|nr:hypothetical protein [Elusimicrobiota bacterium]
MKHHPWRATAVLFAAALTGVFACSSANNGSGCGGSSSDTETDTSAIATSCGPGTTKVGNTCVK